MIISYLSISCPHSVTIVDNLCTPIVGVFMSFVKNIHILLTKLNTECGYVVDNSGDLFTVHYE